ncbi:glutamic acid-rich protein-like isoform X2 [Schistocerca gregaria]|uniref:glutamic acid-rich protein-like isoform X2 n=1 Tax=Schistocerca gregaria TaxID=7010 RepID=UPI00211F46E5|nr:glutamic acid-rich protein-like isoform X2 [Schistocerca gregaria]
MSWRWQVNNPQQIATLLTLQQQQQQQRQQQQQQLPIRWVHEYQHQLPQTQLHQQQHHQQLQHDVQQHHQQQLQYPLQRRVPSPWLDVSSSLACAAQRELYEDTLPARNTRRTIHNDNRHSVLYHEGKGNDFPFHETRTEVFHPGHGNRRLLNEVYEARSGLYNEVLPTRNVQPATDTDYRHNGLYYKRLQNRFPYHDDRSEIFLTEEKQRRFLDESNEFRRRMWHAQESCSTFERQHEYHRSPRDRSVGPDKRCSRYRSKSVGPELGCRRTYDTDSRRNTNNGENKLFFKQNSQKIHSSCSDYTDVGEKRERNIRRGNEWRTGSNLSNENGYKTKKAHSEMRQPRSRKRKGSVSPAKNTDSAIDGIKKKRRNVRKRAKIKRIACESSVMPNSESAPSSTHKSAYIQENRVGDGPITQITRTVSNFAEETPSSVTRNGNDQSASRNWQLTPLEDVPLNRSLTPLSGITRTVLNANAERTHGHKAGERNHRLRSFREEEEEEEKMVEDEEEEEEEEEGSGSDGDSDIHENDDEREEGEGSIHNNDQREKAVETRSVEHEVNINTDQQSAGECIGNIECTKDANSKHADEKAAQQQPDLPEYNSDVPVGRSLLKWTLGLRCRMCHKFFLEYEQAEQHCQTLEHYNNYVKRLSELQCALNIDPMDGPKALELDRLLEDEPPSNIPPESSYLSELCSGLM